MAEKNWRQGKWLNDQFNERNPGQRNHPDAPKGPLNPTPVGAFIPAPEEERAKMTVKELVAELIRCHVRSNTSPTLKEVDRIIAEGSDLEVKIAGNLVRYDHPRLREEDERRRRLAREKKVMEKKKKK